MANPADSSVQNLLPVQALFDAQGDFQTFIGQNKPFFATPNPQQSGLQITNSTINSSVIGGITPAAANFTTATVSTQPVGATDVVNLLSLQSYAAGISWKQPCYAATLTSITLSGLQSIDGYTVADGNRVLVKNQGTASQNGIYLASAGPWTRSSDANTWSELICAISFIEYGSQAGGAFFCTAQDGGTIGVTANTWSQFTTSATYSAGTGLTLTGTVFSITNTAATAGTYGSASRAITQTVNAQGQITNIFDAPIDIAASQIGSGILGGTYGGTGVNNGSNTLTLSGSYTLNQAVASGSAPTFTGTNFSAIPNSALSNSTISGIALGSNLAALTIGTALSGTSYNGSTAVTIALANTAVSAGSYTSANITVDPQGRITSAASGSSMVYPGAGIPNSTGSAWGTSYGTSGANSVVLRDANQNVFANSFNGAGTVTVANSATPVTLTVASAEYQTINTGSGAQTFYLPNATTLVLGKTFYFNNNITSNTVNIYAADTTTLLVTIPIGGSIELICTSIATSNGTWDIHGYAPSTAQWGKFTLAYSGTITGSTWNGSTIGVAYGGTGSTTLAANNVLLGNGTSALQTVAPGTNGNVLTSNGTTWASTSLPASSINIADDTTTNADRYLTFTSATTGTITTANVSSTKLKYNPSTGALTASTIFIAP